MIAYTSRTGTRTTIAALRAHGWRLLVSAAGDHRHEGMPYALDNGAWSAFTQGREADWGRFESMVAKLGRDADWVVCPDVVGDARATFKLIDRWLPKLGPDVVPRVLVAVQDGMSPIELEQYVPRSSRVGIFLGGSDAWKESSMRSWGVWCASRAAHLHVARINTRGRMRRAAESCADSFDGSSPVRFPSTLPKLDRWRSEGTLEGPAQCDQPRDYQTDATFVRTELPTLRDDHEIVLTAGALRALLAG